MLLGIESDLREVRDAIRLTEETMRNSKRGASKRLIQHWQTMLDLFRNRERDLVAIKLEWERRVTHPQLAAGIGETALDTHRPLP
jgi:hypothetical protein